MYQEVKSKSAAAGCGPASRQTFGQTFNNRAAFGGYRRPKYNVPLNIIENEENFEAHVYASGFGKEHIKLTVSDDVLIVSGSKEVKPESEPLFTKQEFPIKNFERTLLLNGQVDIDKISASHVDGVLIIILPKTPEAKVKERNVEVN